MMRLLPIALISAAALFLFAGCTLRSAETYVDEAALTVQMPAHQTRSLDLPTYYFDEILPQRYQHCGIGFINTQEQFQELWKIYAREATALPPVIDFRDYVLLFAYDPEYYNQVSFKGINIWKGIANPFIERTRWTLSIGGDPRTWKDGKPDPEKAKVNVAFLQIPRHREGHPGVTAILVSGEQEVLPVPAEP